LNQSYDQGTNITQILDIHLFVLGGFISTKTITGYHKSLGERIGMTYRALDVREVIEDEMRERKGRTIVSCKYP
jgi:hypothetical protein